MYINFVSPEVDDVIKQNINQSFSGLFFINNNFEIAPVLKALFKSETLFMMKKARKHKLLKSPLDSYNTIHHCY